jgi:hypothetical protein
VASVELIDEIELLGVKTYTLGPKIVLFCAKAEVLRVKSPTKVRQSKNLPTTVASNVRFLIKFNSGQELVLT